MHVTDDSRVGTVPAAADAPTEISWVFTFDDVNPCSGDMHTVTVTIAGTRSVHEHNGRIVARDERTITTSPTGLVGHGTDTDVRVAPSHGEKRAAESLRGAWPLTSLVLGLTSAQRPTARSSANRIEEVHPFDDGNGRVARIMMNAETRRAWPARLLVAAARPVSSVPDRSLSTEGRSPDQ